ncbi:hypothetical protein KZP23_01810 [Echinicola marina]|uniref:hypothetical protein n=1 Tax=Echinicola marina TaxID=2859768 RepID=UPI001CF60FE0|nr:hypothetical protein [Echinicola marina]UCS93798.1 hypothetical protein KZP23_01810 [Echinicola marina]
MKKKFRLLERNVLILIAIPLPMFAFAYLYTSSSNMELDLPKLPENIKAVGLGLVGVIIIAQFVQFNQGLKKLRNPDMPLETKLEKYGELTMLRFWMLFVSGLLCGAGLLLFDSPGYTIGYALTLGFVSLGKPTPDRIIRLLKLKGEQRATVAEFGRRDD